ncbi:MAG: aminopeptidase N [Rhizobiales bacterium]|nr:aminopeptidase N [Hyphomicrobiales bacterium]
MLRTDTAPNTEAPTIKLKNYKPFDYPISSVDLDFKLHPTATIVTSTVNYRRRKGVKAGAPLKLDGDGLKLVSIKLNGEVLKNSDFKATPQLLTIRNLPTKFILEIVTEIDPTANTALSGLYRSGGNYCTQCEAEGFRRITYFPDRPDVLAVYTTRIEADKKENPILLGNGNPQKKGKLANGNHFAIWHDPHPKPAYLFALVGGDLGAVFENYLTSDGRKVKLGIYVEKGKEDRTSYAMDALVRSMKWDEEVFGCVYDLDVFNIVAVSDFNMGAMENKGLNIFNDKYVLADKDTATDATFAQVEAIIAHEYFHNWTGNRITCRDWFQLCLKEGLTVFRDQEFSSDMRSRPVQRIADVAQLRARQFPEDAGPLSHCVRPEAYKEINNFYTATIYEKGAEIVRMIQTLLGNKKFRKGIALYLKRHDGDAATIEDFIKSFEDAAKVDLSQFALWYSQAGTPRLMVSTNYDSARQIYSVEVEQSLSPTPGQPRKKLMHMPLRIGLVGKNGDIKAKTIEGADYRDDVFEIKARKHKIKFLGIKERPILSINRNFSAPVEVDYRHTDKDLIFLAKNDHDLFNRWQAIRTSATKQIINAMRSILRKKKPKWNADYLTAIVDIACDDTLEPAFRASMISLPSESDIAQTLGKNIDPDAIHTARNSLQVEIGEALQGVSTSVLKALKLPKDFISDAEGSGKRKLANMLTVYGLHAGNEAIEKQVVKNFKAAKNMTDKEAAFSAILNHLDDPEIAEQTIASFYNKYKTDPIVIDKWFMLQAMVGGRKSVSYVKQLCKHEDFTWTNPNRVRSVIAVFSSANPTGFNRKDGEGYRFVAKSIKKLDGINPQTAARLLTAFGSWKMLEPSRRKLAHASLKSLSAEKKLSRDVRDILDRMLA